MICLPFAAVSILATTRSLSMPKSRPGGNEDIRSPVVENHKTRAVLWLKVSGYRLFPPQPVEPSLVLNYFGPR